MTDKEKNDLFYVCSLIEYIARQTKNKRGVIVRTLGKDGVIKQLHDAEELIKIFSSFISDKISGFRTDVFYQNPSYLECSYEAGYLLD